MTTSKKGLSRAAKGWIIGGSLALVLAGGYAGTAYALVGQIPHDTTVHGVAVGGLSNDEALEKLTAELGPLAEQPFDVAVDGESASIDPADAGLGIDLESTVSGYAGFTLDPVKLWQHVVGGSEVAPELTVDETKLAAALKAAAETLDVAPTEGTLEFDGVEPAVTEPVPGEKVAQDAAFGTVVERWFDPASTIELPTTTDPVDVPAEEFDRAVENLAEPLVADTVTVRAEGHSAKLSPELLAGAATFTAENGSVDLELDAEEIVESLGKDNSDLGVEPREARVVLEDGKPKIIPSKTGLRVSPKGLGEKIVAAANTQERSVSAEAEVTEPEFTTKDAEAWGIDEEILTFSTPYPKYDSVRTQNLKAGQRKLNGVIVKPGETFSLIGVLAPITKENGYFESGVVESGFSTTALGGGLSQISTQMFNVGWLAGYDDVEHRPHTRWFDRYPAGREATLWEGQIDMKWKNNTDTAVMIQAWVGQDRVYTRLWGTKHWDVKTSTSKHYNLTDPETKYNEADECVPESGGEKGFTVNNTRTRTSASETLPKETLTWTYAPWHKVVCGPPPGDDDK
ncbi:VanW family protein [Zhihengliuella halotolerans]|uniref:Vancomycin resistance protein YoaR n=1 Tax=Zhihengliuella halotolerans TaxID=370736 RepID=A0A4Q8AAT5_9MICC|nr:VanW family protein [Zhihengliuella halotolerans]RZU61250.1 vancomycin resistance protein YoaR [Zhihengliuella halotolerans]